MGASTESLATNDAEPTSADVDIDGAADAAAATIVVDGATVDRVVKAAMKAKFGVAVTATTLVAPDTLRISVAGASVEGRLVIDATGALGLSTPLGTTPVLSLDSAFPLRLEAVRAIGANLELDATLDAQALIGG